MCLLQFHVVYFTVCLFAVCLFAETKKKTFWCAQFEHVWTHDPWPCHRGLAKISPLRLTCGFASAVALRGFNGPGGRKTAGASYGWRIQWVCIVYPNIYFMAHWNKKIHEAIQVYVRFWRHPTWGQAMNMRRHADDPDAEGQISLSHHDDDSKWQVFLGIRGEKPEKEVWKEMVVSKIGVPPNHPFLRWIFLYKPSILGTPMTMETPKSLYNVWHFG